MGYLKLTYSQKEKPIFWEVWKNPENVFQGVDWYDYGSRHYDPKKARWFNLDPQAEKYNSMSPYNYVGNNPIAFIDPNGEFPWGVVVPALVEFTNYTLNNTINQGKPIDYSLSNPYFSTNYSIAYNWNYSSPAGASL
jgi:RHS repeat-associated protein